MNTFMPPSSQLAVPPPQPPPVDPMELLAALKALAGTTAAAPSPVYPSWYKPPKKPDPRRIKSDGDLLFEDNAQWRSLVWTTLRWTRGELRGVFEEDREARENKMQEEYPGTGLSDERNLIVSKLSTMTPIFKKAVKDDNLREKTQQVIDGAYWLRDQFAIAHSLAGNRPLEIDEASMLTDYGMLSYRHVLNKDNPEDPVDLSLIDPASINAVWAGKRGLKAVYRVYRDTIENICGDYGDFNKATYRALESKYGKEIVRDGRCEVDVTEYWDSWWRCVIVDDQTIIPVTAHEYGEVPFTIQYGALGEPMFTRTPSTPAARMGTMGEVLVSAGIRSEERVHKAVPLIYYSVRRHELYESVMARVLFAFKRETNPPFFRKRSIDAGNRPLPDLDDSPGGQNELMEDETIVPWPAQVGGSASQMLMQNMGIDRATNQSPMSAYGSTGDKSNVTGAAQQESAAAGGDKVTPHVKAYTRALANVTSACFRLIQRHGDLAKYSTDEPTPLMVPNRRTRTGQKPAFELNKDLLDAVGSTVECQMSQLTPRDWLQLFQAGKIGVDEGFTIPRRIAELAGEHDYDGMSEEWREEKTIRQAMEHPKFAEMFTVPWALQEQIDESAGDPDAQRAWEAFKQAWMQFVALQPQMPPGGGGGMPPQGAPAAPPPPQGGPLGPAAGAPGVSMPGLGLGPGIQGGAVGRPPGT